MMTSVQSMAIHRPTTNSQIALSVLGLTAASLHVLSPVLAFASLLAAGVVLYLGQLALAFWILVRINKTLAFQDIRLIFVLFYSLYGLMLPISTLAGYGGVQGVSPDTPGLIGAIFLYASGLIGFNLVQLLLQVRWRDPSFATTLQGRSTALGRLVMIGSVVWLIAYALSQGVSLVLTIDRTGRDLIYTQLWVVSVFVVNGVFLYFIWIYPNLRLGSRLVLWFCLLVYVGFIALSLGARRDFLPLLLFALAVTASNKKLRLNTTYIFLAILIFAAFMFIGVMRELPKDRPFDWQEGVEMAFSNNEFSIPIRQTIPYIETEGWTPKFGWTYVYWPLIFVPREVWKDKPISLAGSSGANTGISSGAAAYTPVTEAFVNFLWLGPFVVLA